MSNLLKISFALNVLALVGVVSAQGQVSVIRDFGGPLNVGESPILIGFDEFALDTTYYKGGTASTLSLSVDGISPDGRLFGLVPPRDGGVLNLNGSLDLFPEARIRALAGDYTIRQTQGGTELWKGDSRLRYIPSGGTRVGTVFSQVNANGFYQERTYGLSPEPKTLFDPSGRAVDLNIPDFAPTFFLDSQNRQFGRMTGTSDFYFYDVDDKSLSLAAPSLSTILPAQSRVLAVNKNDAGDIFLANLNESSGEIGYLFHSLSTGWVNLADQYDLSALAAVKGDAIPTLQLQVAKDGSLGVYFDETGLVYDVQTGNNFVTLTKPVPEPATILLFALTGAGVALRRRKTSA